MTVTIILCVSSFELFVPRMNTNIAKNTTISTLVIVSRMDAYAKDFLAHFSAQHKMDLSIEGVDKLDKMNNQMIIVIDANSIGVDTVDHIEKVFSLCAC